MIVINVFISFIHTHFSHPLLENKIMPDFFQDDESKGDQENSKYFFLQFFNSTRIMRVSFRFSAVENIHPQSAYTEHEFVDHVGFY